MNEVPNRSNVIAELFGGTRGYTQPVTLGIDAGYETVGFSAVNESEELIRGEFKLLESFSERITERRKYRRTRRNRLRHRAPRFDNRRRKQGESVIGVEPRYMK